MRRNGWTDSEIALIRRHYRRGPNGRAARGSLFPHLPNRTKRAIVAFTHRLRQAGQL